MSDEATLCAKHSKELERPTLGYEVVERSVDNPDYVKVVRTLDSEDDALRHSLNLTKSYSGGGKYYVVRPQK